MKVFTPEKHVERWLKDWVINLNLCPFAKYPYELGRVRIVSSGSKDDDEVFQFILDEIEKLIQTPADEIETTLVVVPYLLGDFNEYLDFLDLLQNVLQEIRLEGVIQVASFHPDYCFEGVEANDPSNYTNRTPYPLFHLIREESLETALQHYDHPEEIPERNVELLRSMSLEEIKKRLAWIDLEN